MSFPTVSSVEEAAAQVQSFNAENPVVVYSKEYCPFCRMAKQVFKETNYEPIYIELDQRGDGGVIQDALQQITGQRTVPNVIIGGKSVGGGSEVKALHASGQLVPMLQQVGVL